MVEPRRSRVDLSQVFAGLDKLVEVKESLARTMGNAMGVAVRDEAKIRVPIGTEQGGSISPGLLHSAIYNAYDDQRSILAPGSYRYTVSWNSKKAPHGHLIEFGHWMPYRYVKTDEGDYFTPKPLEPNPGGGPDGFWVEQRAFLGPAFDATMPRLASIAYQAGSIRFVELMK